MTKLSVNINKIAVVRNSRGGNMPDVVRAALDIETGVAARFHEKGIRVSVFVDPDPAMVAGAKACGADRVELYTEAYAREYPAGADAALAPYLAAAEEARRQGLGLNAGHDLSLENLRFFVGRIPWTDEVSIGHALICDALYYGLENTEQLYKRELRYNKNRSRI